MNKIVILLSLLVLPQQDVSDRSQETNENAAIKRVLSAQAKAWNDGEIDTFMETYWKSEKLSFSSGGKTTRGWKATRDRYFKRYPTRAAMGRLTFHQLEVTSLGKHSAMVLGRWQLKRKTNGEPNTIGGNFTLVLRHVDGGWKIVHDHTSKSED